MRIRRPLNAAGLLSGFPVFAVAASCVVPARVEVRDPPASAGAEAVATPNLLRAERRFGHPEKFPGGRACGNLPSATERFLVRRRLHDDRADALRASVAVAAKAFVGRKSLRKFAQFGLCDAKTNKQAR
ncbi:MAG TPA: hypothetical protein VIT22_10645 [Pseudoxanthomonas sp.]